MHHDRLGRFLPPFKRGHGHSILERVGGAWVPKPQSGARKPVNQIFLMNLIDNSSIALAQMSANMIKVYSSMASRREMIVNQIRGSSHLARAPRTGILGPLETLTPTSIVVSMWKFVDYSRVRRQVKHVVLIYFSIPHRSTHCTTAPRTAEFCGYWPRASTTSVELNIIHIQFDVHY